jgi:hypothetical protein
MSAASTTPQFPPLEDLTITTASNATLAAVPSPFLHAEPQFGMLPLPESPLLSHSPLAASPYHHHRHASSISSLAMPGPATDGER